MINNRQGGRRRGRGGQRPQGMPGSSGNARDNRQRGNAAQLLEKYKNMARDAQLAGDRVQTEYYLQFADHYFRVLGESRVRFEEQRRDRGEDLGDDEGDELIEAEAEAEGDGEGAERHQQPRRERMREDRPEREERREPRAARNGRPESSEDGPRMPFDALPPAIGGDGDEGEADEAPRVARRPRRARPAAGEGGEATA